MNRDKYEEAWSKLLSARRSGTLGEIAQRANELAQAARALYGGIETLPCSHFMVVNGHCINCHEPVGPTHREHANQMECDHRGLFDERGVCSRCGYSASQWPQSEKN